MHAPVVFSSISRLRTVATNRGGEIGDGAVARACRDPPRKKDRSKA
jgi:hypothetical protein